MKKMLLMSAIVALMASVSVAQAGPGGPQNGGPTLLDLACKHMQHRKCKGRMQDECHPEMVPPSGGAAAEIKPICELSTGFGLVGYAANTALLNQIKADLAAGKTVTVDFAGNTISQVTPDGAAHVIGVVERPNKPAVICYQTH